MRLQRFPYRFSNIVRHLLALGAALLLAPLWAGVLHAADDFLDPAVAFKTRLDQRGGALALVVDIAPGYYVYRDKFKFSATPDSLGKPVFPAGQSKKDDTFGEVVVYHDQARVELPVQPGSPLPQRVQVTLQGCAEGGLCYPPQKRELPVADSGAASAAPAGTSSPSVPALDESGRIAQMLGNASIVWVLLSFFGFGLLLALTPCVLPMVPILSSIIVGSSDGGASKARSFSLSLAYVLGMAITYSAAGVAAGMTGTLLSNALQNAWVLGGFALVFVALSLSMFGFYELQMPNTLQSSLSDNANRQGGGRHFGVAVMGALSALIVGPCVAAPLAGALLYIGQTGNAALGGAALFCMALGMGSPLLLIGASAGKLLPRAGMWMESVKKFFGVLLLGTAIWLVTPVTPAWFPMLAWGSLLIVASVFLHALDPLPKEAKGGARFWKGVGVVSLLYGAALIAGLLSGGRDPMQPLQAFAGQANARTTDSAAPLAWKPVRSVAELDRAIAGSGKPVVLDFSAEWCVACKEMEKFTFHDPQVSQQLRNFELLRADVTANSAEDSVLLRRFGLFGPPGVLFIGKDGKEASSLRVVGFQNATPFLHTLAQAVRL